MYVMIIYLKINEYISSLDRRQWTAIGVLTGLMIIVIILFYVL